MLLLDLYGDLDSSCKLTETTVSWLLINQSFLLPICVEYLVGKQKQI